MRVFLEYLGEIIELPAGESLIGRAVDCWVRLDDPSVSRRHVRIVFRDGQACCEDLGTTNGTAINGSRIHGVHVLQHGDIVQVGCRRVRVVFADHDAPVLHRPLPVSSSQRPATAQYQRPAPPRDQGIPTQALDSGTATQRLDARVLGRRSDPRRLVSIPALYSSDNLTFDGITRDLSHGGVYIDSELLDPIGTACQVNLLPRGHGAVTFQGVVCHVVQTQGGAGGRPPGLGIKFTSASDDARRWLEKALMEADRAYGPARAAEFP